MEEAEQNGKVEMQMRNGGSGPDALSPSRSPGSETDLVDFDYYSFGAVAAIGDAIYIAKRCEMVRLIDWNDLRLPTVLATHVLTFFQLSCIDRNGAEEEWRVAHVHEEALCSESPPEPTGSGQVFSRCMALYLGPPVIQACVCLAELIALLRCAAKDH
eukprot:scaffold238859_cov15-Tisochrysis_lutea.AAC.1